MSPAKFISMLAAAIISTCAGSPSSAAPVQRIEWAPHVHELRSGEKIPASLGSLDVPLVRASGDGRTLKLRFVRLPALAKAAGPPIIYLAGGPGSSGIEAGQGDRYRLFERLRRHGDVILLDQRGTGLSSPPPACSTPWSFPREAVATEESIRPSFEAGLRACAAEWRAAGVELGAYNTADNAADVADLIRALGVPKARLVGISYGTFLGFAVLRDHESLIDRAVFAGTEGPDDTVKLPTQTDAALTELSSEIASTDEGKAVAPDLEAAVRRIFARLARAPATAELEDGSKVTVSLFDAQLVTAFLMATSENAVVLPNMYKSMESGDFRELAAMAQRLRGFYGAYPAMSYATDAASGSSPERLAEAARLARISLFGNAANFPNVDIRKALGVDALPPRYWSPLRTSVPALFISGTFDWRTPAGQAEEVRRGFRNSAHLILDGAGHDNDLFLSSPRILDRIDAFFSGQPIRDETVKVDILKFE